MAGDPDVVSFIEPLQKGSNLYFIEFLKYILKSYIIYYL